MGDSIELPSIGDQQVRADMAVIGLIGNTTDRGG